MFDFFTGDVLTNIVGLLFKKAELAAVVYRLKWLIMLTPIWLLGRVALSKLAIRFDGKNFNYDNMEKRLDGNPLALAVLGNGRLIKRGLQRGLGYVADALFVFAVLSS